MRIKKLPLFYKIFFAVLLVLTAAAAVGIWVLNGILADYEAVQPKHVADGIFQKYYVSRDFESLAKKCAAGNAFEPSAEVAKYLHEKYDGTEMTCTSGKSDDGRPTYIVKVGDYKISSFSLKESAEKTKRGWTQYEEGEFVIYYDTESVSVTAPEGYSVYVNSVLLDESYVAEEGLPGEGDELLPDGVEGVRYTRFCVDGLINEPEIKVESPRGEACEAAYSEEEKTYLAKPVFDAELEKEYRDYVLKAAQEYSKYMESDSWWGAVAPYFDPESDVYESARTSLTMFVIDHDGYRFDDVFVGEFYGYSGEVFSCRVSFTHVLTAGAQEYRDYFDSTLFFRLVDGTWRICGMVNHA